MCSGNLSSGWCGVSLQSIEWGCIHRASHYTPASQNNRQDRSQSLHLLTKSLGVLAWLPYAFITYPCFVFSFRKSRFVMQKTSQVQQAHSSGGSEKHQVTDELKPVVNELNQFIHSLLVKRTLCYPVTLTPPGLQALVRALGCALAMEGTTPTLSHTSPRGLKDCFLVLITERHWLNRNPWCTNSLFCMAFWEKWWSNSPALKKNSIILQESLRRNFFSSRKCYIL